MLVSSLRTTPFTASSARLSAQTLHAVPIGCKRARRARAQRAAAPAWPPQPLSRAAPVCRCDAGAAAASGVVDEREARLRGYLEIEAGLKPYQADRLMRELERRQEADVEWLQARVAGLTTAFGPGSEAEVAAALYNGGLDLLDRDAASFPRAIIALKEVLPGVNVLDVVSREPRLLYADAVGPASNRVITKLTSIYPYKSPNKKADVIRMVAEYPELLVRMTHYAEDKAIKRVEDLPVDLQNRILRNYC